MQRYINQHKPDKKLLSCARGEEPCDIVLKNGQIINVFTGEILPGNIGLCGKHIAGIGEYEGLVEVDLDNQLVSPGFIEGHIHLESTLLEPRQFAQSILHHGTTTVVCDPHEIANVSGLKGIEYFLETSKGLPVDIFIMAPSCVPATDMETSGATLEPDDLAEIFKYDRVLGLAELMNFPGVIAGQQEVIEKIRLTHESKGRLIDGHAPGLSGLGLQAYIAAGISSDHECTTLAEATEKLRHGMYIYIREGSTAKNLKDLLPLLTPETEQYCLFVSDDLDPRDLYHHGHLDRILRKAVDLGLKPINALKLVTINPARRFGLYERGAIAPGYLADLVIMRDLSRFEITSVYSHGQLVVKEGKTLYTLPEHKETISFSLSSSININRALIDFSIPAIKETVRTIGVIDDQLITKHLEKQPKIINKLAVADPKQDLLKISVIERHHATGRITNGFVKGFGLRQGALASTIAHDSHNLIVIGATDQEMMFATEKIVNMNGGLVVVKNKNVLASLPLPIAGLISFAKLKELSDELNKLLQATQELGCTINNPFMAMSFLALPVIPELKITDKGLVDVNRFKFVSFWV